MRKGWEIKKLGEVCDISSGKSNTEDADENGEYAFFDRSKTIKRSSKYLFDSDSIIIAGEGQTFPPKFYSGKFDLHQRAYALFNFNQKINVLFAFNYLIHFQKYFENVAVGTTVKSLRLRHFQELPIPVPPLSEQQRIVSILDEAFSSIEQAKENLQRNLQNAKELFQSELNSIFTNKGEGWEETTLKANIELSTGFAFKSKFYTDNEDDILLLRGDNIMQGNFRWQDAKRWNKSEYEDYEKYQLQENDIVLAMDRPWVKAGLKCAKLTKNELPSLLVQRTARLRATSKIDSSFLYHLIRSRGFIAYLLKGQTGLGVPHISGPQILSFIFSKPSIIDQQKTVQQLDKLSTETKRLEAMYQQKLDALEELKKSILQKAFSGELSEN